MNKSYQPQIFIPSILKIGEDELNNLGSYLQQNSFNNIACFYSSGIEDLFGDKVNAGLEKSNIKVLQKTIIEEINIENIIHTAFQISKDVDALVGIGGGKALDYSKYCAYILGLPFISVPTSISNDGFCSPMSSLLVEGKRKTVNAKIPYGVIVDTNIIKTAPEICIYSGIGDLISKVTSGWDWKKAVELEKSTFNDFAYLISQSTMNDFLSYQKQDIKSIKFIDHLVNSLLMSGISMEIAGSSRPASGSEHLISHSLDMISKFPQMHGIQVGFSTYVCSYLQNNQFDLVKDFLINTGFFEFLYKNPLNKDDYIKAIEQANTIKEDFYTVLTDPNNIDKAIEFINTDDICKDILKNQSP